MAHIKEKKIFKTYGPIRPLLTYNSRKFSWKGSESRSRELFGRNESKSIACGALWHSHLAGHGMLSRDFIYGLLAKTNYRGSVSRLKNRCIFVGYSRSTNQKLFVSRHTLRRFIRFGNFPGFINP